MYTHILPSFHKRKLKEDGKKEGNIGEKEEGRKRDEWGNDENDNHFNRINLIS